MSIQRRSFPSEFEEQARRLADHIAVVDAQTKRSWTYGEVDQVTRRLVSWLRYSKFAQNQLIASVLPSGVEQLFCFLAALRAGFDFAPLSPQMNVDSTVTLIRMVGAGACLVPENIEPSIAQGFKAEGISPVSISTDSDFRWLEAIDDSSSEPPCRGAQRASRLFVATSGTTAEPKMIIIDSDNLWSSSAAFVKQHSFLGQHSGFYSILPMSYLGGLFNLGLIPLACGGKIVVSEASSGASLLGFWDEVDRLGVTILWLTPTMLRGLLDLRRRTRQSGACVPAHRVQAAFVGMAPVDLRTKKEFESEFGISLLENYGMSESTFISTETMDTRLRRMEGSVGQVLPRVEVRLAGRPEDGMSDPANHELEVRSPFLCEGYLESGGTVPLPMTSDGYFQTGDLGHFEQDGTLVLGGRTRDIIKKGGYFVSLRELESFTGKHPLIEEAVAVGVKHSFYGEDAVLFVRLRSDAGVDGTVGRLRDVRSWIIGEIPRFMWPSQVIAVKEFPRTSSGKAQKRLLSRQLDNQESFLDVLKV